GMSFDDLAQHFRSADLVIYPSYYEGQGLIPLESMSSGTPVVTVDMAPLTEMVDDTVGGLFESGNSQDLAKTVNEILDNCDEKVSMSIKGRQLIMSKYTYEHNANDFIEIYQSIIK
ncbi:MAG: glycosyltransferase family 4 protein, partial [Candidatus Thermoplasmatota archaeon]|nr:glycosyltransferase family 4 protein [Candidatus Thermoplasmatota archaeon]